MKYATCLLCGLLLFSTLYSQNSITSYDPKTTLTSDQCFDVVKATWDGLKKISEEYESDVAVKSEFESTAEFNERLRKSKDQYVSKVRKFSDDNNLTAKSFSVWMKADLIKYDADNQVYSVKSPTQILVQPKKKDIAITCPANKYLIVTEKNEKGYRRAFLQLNTDPDFSWYVNKVTAQAAKAREQQIYFKLTFTFDIRVNESDGQIILQITPHKLALIDQSENFTYWSEDIF